MVNSKESMKKEKLNDENLEKLSGGDGYKIIENKKENYIFIVPYERTDGRSKIRTKLKESMEAHGIPTNLLPSAFKLWADGMTAGCKAGTLVYECKENGKMVNCYKG